MPGLPSRAMTTTPSVRPALSLEPSHPGADKLIREKLTGQVQIPLLDMKVSRQLPRATVRSCAAGSLSRPLFSTLSQI